jgi:CRISPR-associated protein Cas4
MLSVSALTTYLYCPRKLYLTKVLGFIEPLRDASIIGSLRHDIYDRINKIEREIVLSIKEPDATHIQQQYKNRYAQIVRSSIIRFKPMLNEVKLDLTETFKTIWPFLEKEYKFRSRNIYEFMQENCIIGEQLWEKLTPKIESEVSVQSDKLELRGVVDRVEIYKGNIIPAELKTGKAPTDTLWEAHKIQLAAYMLLLEEKYGLDVRGGYVHYLNEDLKYDVIMNPFLKDEVIGLIQKVKELLDTSKIPEIIDSENRCNACSLKPECHDKQLINEKMGTNEKRSGKAI